MFDIYFKANIYKQEDIGIRFLSTIKGFQLSDKEATKISPYYLPFLLNRLWETQKVFGNHSEFTVVILEWLLMPSIM